MGKRNIRILRREIPSRISQITGKEIQAVLVDGTTIAGTLTKVEGQNAVISTINAGWHNRKRHTHSVAFMDISEIILDEVTEW